MDFVCARTLKNSYICFHTQQILQIVINFYFEEEAVTFLDCVWLALCICFIQFESLEQNCGVWVPDKLKQQLCTAWLEPQDICIAVTDLSAFPKHHFMSSFSSWCTVHSVSLGAEFKVNAVLIAKIMDFFWGFSVPEEKWVGERWFCFWLLGDGYASVTRVQNMYWTR